MDLVPVLLSRIQFAFVISFHIIFPAFTVGLAAWLATLERTRLATGNPVYRRVFDFWLNCLRSRSVRASSPKSSWRFSSAPTVLSERTGSIQELLLGYERFTAFMAFATSSAGKEDDCAQ